MGGVSWSTAGRRTAGRPGNRQGRQAGWAGWSACWCCLPWFGPTIREPRLVPSHPHPTILSHPSSPNHPPPVLLPGMAQSPTFFNPSKRESPPSTHPHHQTLSPPPTLFPPCRVTGFFEPAEKGDLTTSKLPQLPTLDGTRIGPPQFLEDWEVELQVGVRERGLSSISLLLVDGRVAGVGRLGWVWLVVECVVPQRVGIRCAAATLATPALSSTAPAPCPISCASPFPSHPHCCRSPRVGSSAAAHRMWMTAACCAACSEATSDLAVSQPSGLASLPRPASHPLLPWQHCLPPCLSLVVQDFLLMLLICLTVTLTSSLSPNLLCC